MPHGEEWGFIGTVMSPHFPFILSGAKISILLFLHFPFPHKEEKKERKQNKKEEKIEKRRDFTPKRRKKGRKVSFSRSKGKEKRPRPL